jgi:hypothetical protein
MGFMRPWPLGFDQKMGYYGSPKDNGRRFLFNRQRRARPKRRGRRLIPMSALSKTAVISRRPAVVLPEPSPDRDHALRLLSKPKHRSCQALYKFLFIFSCLYGTEGGNKRETVKQGKTQRKE